MPKKDVLPSELVFDVLQVFAKAQERIAIAAERQADALERIADSLQGGDAADMTHAIQRMVATVCGPEKPGGAVVELVTHAGERDDAGDR